MAERQPPAPLLPQFLQSFSLRPVLLCHTVTASGLCLVPGWLFEPAWLVRILNVTLEFGAGFIAASFAASDHLTRSEPPAVALGGEALTMGLGYAATSLLFQAFGHRNGTPMPSPARHPALIRKYPTPRRRDRQGWSAMSEQGNSDRESLRLFFLFHP